VDKWKWLIKGTARIQSEIIPDAAREQHGIPIYGKTHPGPRLTAFVAEGGVCYPYSGNTMCGVTTRGGAAPGRVR